MDVLLPILDWVLPVAAACLTLVLAALAKKHIEKLGIERSDRVDNMIDKYVGMGINAAERAANAAIAAQQGKMPGESKKAHAVKVVLNELDQSGIKGVGEELISDRIESWLEVKDPKVSSVSETGSESSTTV